MTDEMGDWIDDQFRARGWTEEQLKSGNTYNKWEFRTKIAGLSCLFVITGIIGVPLMAIGAMIMYLNNPPGKTYRKGRKELEDEFKRRQRNGEALYEPVSEDWWSKRLPPSWGLEN